ncbi:MAG: VWA domain-containing protein [Acidobacteriaceae bacterium]
MREVWFGALSFLLVSAGYCQQQQAVPNAPAPQAQTAQQAQPATPNAPAPQPGTLNSLTGQVTPGIGTAAPAAEDHSADTAQHTSSGTVQTDQTPPPDPIQGAPPLSPAPGQPLIPPTPSDIPTFTHNVTVVDVPVIVRDKRNQLVGGLPSWRFRVYEDGVQQRIWWFTTDAYPLSIAFVIDDTLPADIMQKVNQSLSVVSNALTPADSVAVITYSGTGPQMITDFTGAAGNRLPAALQMAKKPGETMGVPSMGDDPFGAGPTVNGQQADPTLAPQHGNAGGFVTIPREVHPLNDAILYAAEQLASQPRGRRRIIYVVSDGKDVRSKAKYNQVREYLLTNNISVYGTEVGDASLWGIGYLDRMKLPLLAPENVLPRYALVTGGDVQAEMSENGIQNAFVHITDSVRTAYTIDYISHQPTLSEKYHNIDVRIEGLPGLTVDAKQGYYPSASASQY